MPSFGDTLSDDERWAISYYVLSFSAWGDPLTGRKLDLASSTKGTLNSPDVKADHPRLAVDPVGSTRSIAGARGRRTIYYPGVLE